MGCSQSKSYKSYESKKFDHISIIKNKKNNILKYKFSYEKKDIINSKIIIYTNVKLINDIKVTSKYCIPSKILYGRLICNPCDKTYIFFSTSFECIYFIAVDNTSWLIILGQWKSDEKIIKTLETDKDMLNCYLQIKNLHTKMFNYHIMRYIKNKDLSNIILNYI
jgi:hypothetical protein